MPIHTLLGSTPSAIPEDVKDNAVELARSLVRRHRMARQYS